MKYFLFLALTSIFLSFTTSCSKDDENNNDIGNKTEYTAQYKKILNDIIDSTARLAKLREEAKSLSGGRLIVVQEQISRESNNLSELKKKKKELEKKLGLALLKFNSSNHIELKYLI